MKLDFADFMFQYSTWVFLILSVAALSLLQHFKPQLNLD